MSRHPMLSVRGPALVALAIIAVVALGAAVALAEHPEDQDANKGGTGLTTMATDWALGAGDDLSYANQTIDLDGNLTLANGGRLVLRNVTLILHGWPWALQEIRLNDGGELVISDYDGVAATTADRSTVRANDTDVHYYFKAYAGSKLTIMNSRVLDCGELFNLQGLQAGIYLATDSVVMDGVEVANGYCGIFIDAVDPTIANCSIHDNDWVGVYVDNGAKPTLVGCQMLDNLREGVSVKQDSELTMRGCRVEGNERGVLVDYAFLNADGCVMRNNNQTADLNLPHQATVNLFNCTLSTNAGWKAVTMENSSLTSTNGNFDIGRVTMQDSSFHYQHFLNVLVTWADSEFTPIQGVVVTIVDAESGIYPEFVTGTDGRVAWIPLKVVAYEKYGATSKTYVYNPFGVTVSRGTDTQSEYVDARVTTASVTFRYTDTTDPTAVPPSAMTVDVGVNVTLDGSRSTDNVAIASWNWSFEELGSMVYLEGETIVYAFKEARIYSVTLKVTDTSGRSGQKGTASFTVTAQDRTPPTASAGPDVSISEGDTVRFDGASSTDNVAIVSYTWSFFDGAPRSLVGVTAQWTFNTPGLYTIVLTVEDASGLSDSATFTVTVSDTTAPVTTGALDSTKPPVDRLYSEVVQVVFTVAGERVNDYTTYYRINGGEWRTFTGSLGFGDGLENGDGTYTIDYYSLDGSGNTETTKTVEAFTVDATVPTFTDMDPAVSPFSTVEPSYVIKGKTEPGATLTINAQPVTLGADGSFQLNVTLVEGDNPFTLIAKDAAGHQADKAIVINYQEQKADREDEGPNWGIIGGIIVVGVVLVIVAYWFISRKKQ